MEKGISYLNRNFNDYRNSLFEFTRNYYPELEDEFNDASIGSWIIDIVSNIGDNLSYHIDRVYQETNIESAKEKNSIYSIARNNGVKIPGPKASMAEVEFTCVLPTINKSRTSSEMHSPDYSYAPCIRRGSKVSAGNQVFEVIHDIDFNEQFNENGVSNRRIMPKRNSNGYIDGYFVTKTGIVSSGESKIFTKTITDSDIIPFMSVVIPDTDIMNIESIIIKEGTNHYGTPTLSDFYYHSDKVFNDKCGASTWRFFEVDYLAQQYIWGDYCVNDKPFVVSGGTGEIPYSIIKGEWKTIQRKFITEYTDSGYLKIIFGSGDKNGISSTAINSEFISYIKNNDCLGVLPNSNSTMYVLYRKGGGAQSNVASGAITNIDFLNLNLRGTDNKIKSDVQRSITVINTTPSVSGRGMLSSDELKYYIKYNNGAQNRCVTIKDYHDRIAKLPARYGCPFRYGVIEENNKIMLYLLGLNDEGKLSEMLPEALIENIINYLSEYRMINDYIEIKSGRIIHLEFQVDLFVDKNYNTSDVILNVINCVKNYMSINRLQMGDDIFVGDIEKEISKIDGVLNLIDLRVYNKYGNGYSATRTTQPILTNEECSMLLEGNDQENTDSKDCIDLKASDKMLYTENDTMFEIKNPDSDIICRVKTR